MPRNESDPTQTGGSVESEFKPQGRVIGSLIINGEDRYLLLRGDLGQLAMQLCPDQASYIQAMRELPAEFENRYLSAPGTRVHFIKADLKPSDITATKTFKRKPDFEVRFAAQNIMDNHPFGVVLSNNEFIDLLFSQDQRRELLGLDWGEEMVDVDVVRVAGHDIIAVILNRREPIFIFIQPDQDYPAEYSSQTGFLNFLSDIHGDLITIANQRQVQVDQAIVKALETGRIGFEADDFQTQFNKILQYLYRCQALMVTGRAKSKQDETLRNFVPVLKEPGAVAKLLRRIFSAGNEAAVLLSHKILEALMISEARQLGRPQVSRPKADTTSLQRERMLRVGVVRDFYTGEPDIVEKVAARRQQHKITLGELSVHLPDPVPIGRSPDRSSARSSQGSKDSLIKRSTDELPWRPMPRETIYPPVITAETLLPLDKAEELLKERQLSELHRFIGDELMRITMLFSNMDPRDVDKHRMAYHLYLMQRLSLACQTTLQRIEKTYGFKKYFIYVDLTSQLYNLADRVDAFGISGNSFLHLVTGSDWQDYRGKAGKIWSYLRSYVAVLRKHGLVKDNASFMHLERVYQRTKSIELKMVAEHMEQILRARPSDNTQADRQIINVALFVDAFLKTQLFYCFYSQWYEVLAYLDEHRNEGGMDSLYLSRMVSVLEDQLRACIEQEQQIQAANSDFWQDARIVENKNLI